MNSKYYIKNKTEFGTLRKSNTETGLTRSPVQIFISGIIFSLLLLGLLGCVEKTADLKVISLNIRYDNPDDGINAWPNRQEIVYKTLKTENPDIIGLQEVLRHQLDALAENLPQYAWFGVGRDDGMDAGEFAPVFFKKSRFNLLDHGTFWLSEHPDSAGSIGWGADLPRILTWVKLYDSAKPDTLFAFNTHYSHVSDEARKFSSNLVIRFIYQLANGKPVVLTGDFNTRNGSEPYNILASGFEGMPGLTDIGAASGMINDQMTTSNGFGRSRRKRIIDFIWTNPMFSVSDYRIREVKEGDVFISDHYPVVGKLTYN